MPDKNGDALPGEKGHWRYSKDSALAKERHGTTGMKDIVKPKEKEEKPKDIVEHLQKKVFNEKEAKDLNRKEQLELLRVRKVNAPSKAKEAELVKLILKSNPKE